MTLSASEMGIGTFKQQEGSGGESAKNVGLPLKALFGWNLDISAGKGALNDVDVSGPMQLQALGQSLGGMSLDVLGIGKILNFSGVSRDVTDLTGGAGGAPAQGEAMTAVALNYGEGDLGQMRPSAGLPSEGVPASRNVEM